MRVHVWIYGFPNSSAVKSLPTTHETQETRFDPWSGRPRGEGSSTQSGIIAWRTPGTEEPGGLESSVLPIIGHDRAPRRGAGGL